MKAMMIWNSTHARTRWKSTASPKICTLPRKMWSSSWVRCPIEGEDIDISHKLYSGKNKPKNIIVKFISHKRKTALYKKRIELKNVKITQLFPHSTTAAALASERLYNQRKPNVLPKRFNERSQPNEKRWTFGQCMVHGRQDLR